MKFYANNVRSIVSTDEKGYFSQERADAFQEFLEEERRIARAEGWNQAVQSVSRSFSASPDLSSKIAERGHSNNHYAID